MKNPSIKTLMACLSGLAIASHVAAATLHTPPLPGGANGLRCEVKNLSNQPAEVTIEVILTGGTLSVNDLTTTIDPLESAVLVTGGSVSVCRFTVPGSRRKFPASACALNAGSGCGGALAAE
jgi:hypothetical protein